MVIKSDAIAEHLGCLASDRVDSSVVKVRAAHDRQIELIKPSLDNLGMIDTGNAPPSR